MRRSPKARPSCCASPSAPTYLSATTSLPAGLDYAALSRQNPRLVLTRVTAPPSNNDGLFPEYFTGLNAFTATLLPLVNMAILGRGQQVEVDSAECLAAAAFVVDGRRAVAAARRR